MSIHLLSHIGETIDGKDDDDTEDSDSDNEEDNDITDSSNNNDETKEKHDDGDDECFFGRFFEALVDKLAVFKTRAGRAGLVHNFLRGLQVMTSAPLFSGLLLYVVYSFVPSCQNERITCTDHFIHLYAIWRIHQK